MAEASTGRPADPKEPGAADHREHRMSVVEAQVVSMRASALAIAETARAFAIQCDTLLLVVTLGGIASRERPAAPMAPPGSRRATFKTPAEREAADGSDDLTSRVADNSPGANDHG